MIREIKYLEDRDIVALTTSGIYELDVEVGTLKTMALMLKAHNCHKCMFDHREADVILGPLISYERTALYEEIWGDRSTRAAAVFRELNQDTRFLETVVTNRGWNAKVFDDYDAAIDWLTI